MQRVRVRSAPEQHPEITHVFIKVTRRVIAHDAACVFIDDEDGGARREVRQGNRFACRSTYNRVYRAPDAGRVRKPCGSRELLASSELNSRSIRNKPRPERPESEVSTLTHS